MEDTPQCMSVVIHQLASTFPMVACSRIRARKQSSSESYYQQMVFNFLRRFTSNVPTPKMSATAVSSWYFVVVNFCSLISHLFSILLY